MNKILVTGALGQIGSELVSELRDKYGRENVIATDIQEDPETVKEPYEKLDVLNKEKIREKVREKNIDTVFHLASILSAKGEENPQLAYQVNFNGLYNILEVSRTENIDKIIVPSSIAAFGLETSDSPSEIAIQRPNTIYGISKVFGELLGNYYNEKYDMDVRGVRFPGVISWKTKPGGGTTDYAVEVFYKAIQEKKYTYFVRKDTKLPLMYMPDAIKALIDLGEANKEDFRFSTSYNVNSLSFPAEKLTQEIKKYIPDFKAEYKPDSRQKIADSWPKSLDDSAAREDWNWRPEFGLEEMAEDMVKNLRRKLES